MWFKYVDNNLFAIVKYLTFGNAADVEKDIVASAQSWLFKWSVLYFDGMNVVFKNDDDSVVDSATITIHMKSEFARLKSTTIDKDIDWHTW